MRVKITIVRMGTTIAETTETETELTEELTANLYSLGTASEEERNIAIFAYPIP
jgi:hypothetical protein